MSEAGDENNIAPTLETRPISFKEALKKLVVLQVKDKEIDDLRQKIDQIPQAIELKNENIAQLKKESEESKELSTRLVLERKNLEADLAKKDEEIKKHGGELQVVKSNEAYKALLDEIANLKDQKDECETKILEVMESMDKAKAEEVEAAKNYESKKKVVEGEIAVLTAEQKQLEETLGALTDARGKFLADVPGDALNRYERLRQKRAVALVPVTQQGSCGGCQMTLTQQILNNLLKARDFVTCESCQRMLYIP